MTTKEIKFLRTETKMENRKHNIRKIAVGEKPFWNWPGTGKVFMVVGATGAGKSTLINGMVNYIMDVNYNDGFRYKLVDDGETRSQAYSQTKWITAYSFYKNDKIPYKLTVIDTPGYGDTQGLERDKEITKQIKEFFSLKGSNSIDQLNGIGFVVQASLPRLSHAQRYIFDSILSIFGKDISDSIFMMVTFADGKKPPVLAAIKEAKVEYQKSFKFNNSALYPDKDDDDDDDDQFNEMYWKMGQKSFENFFQSFAQAKSVSLKLTRQVLDEREQLESVAQGLGPQIRVGLHKVDQLRQEERILKIHEKDIMTNKDFEYEVDVIKHRKIDLPTGEYVTNCIKCNTTCHYPCRIARDEEKNGCAVIYPRDTCNVCPGNCHWRKHFNNGYRFELYTEIQTKTSEELKKRYQEAKSKKMKKEEMMEGLTKELETMYHGLFAMISKARNILERLDEIALKPNPLSEVDYIDLLIQAEEQEAKEGWTRRVEAYRQVRKQAEILSKIKDKKVLQEKTKGSVKRLWQNFQETVL